MTERVDIDEIEVKNFKALLDYLKQLSEDGVSHLIEKQVKMMLDNSLKFFSYLVKQGILDKITRVTINRNVIDKNKRIKNIKYLKYPPSDKVNSYGRCNFPKHSVFYGALDWMTALNELKPNVGDLVTRTTWKVLNDQPLIFCPIFKNQPIEKDVINPRTFKINQEFEKELDKYPPNMKSMINLLVQFITDAFSKNITSGNHLDYIFSAYFADKIFNFLENGKIEAIYYPSVKQKLSFENIAIKPEVFDKKYILNEVKESVVIGNPKTGSKGYMMDGISDCKEFDFSTGEILWNKDHIYQTKETLLELKLLYDIDID